MWLTDVAESAAVPEVIESAARMVPRHVLVFAVTRPAELTALAARAPETDRDLYRVMAAQEMVERRALLLGQLRQRGAMALEVPSRGADRHGRGPLPRRQGTESAVAAGFTSET